MNETRKRLRAATIMVLALGSAVICPALADDCTDFKWDVTQERALFGASATPLNAAADVQAAPRVVPNKLYMLKLLPQEQVTYAARPNNNNAFAGSYGGLVALEIAEAGSYRVSIDMPFWVDVVSYGALLKAKDFQGQRNCAAPHKIVEFELPGVHAYFLQFSGAVPDSVRLTLTRSPPRKL